MMKTFWVSLLLLLAGAEGAPSMRRSGRRSRMHSVVFAGRADGGAALTDAHVVVEGDRRLGAGQCTGGQALVAAGRTLLCVDLSTGLIASLNDALVLGQEFSAQSTPIFQLVFTQAGNDVMDTVLSSACASVLVTAGGSGNPLGVNWAFANCSWYAGAVNVTMAVAPLAYAPQVPAALSFTMNVTGVPPARALFGAAYPLFTMESHSSGTDYVSDTFLGPGGDGVVIPAIGAQAVTQEEFYPGAACVQLVARTTNLTSILMATLDAGANAKLFTLSSSPGKGTASMQVAHISPEVLGASVAVAYPTIVATFVGDWRAAALHYKAWAVQQWWAATPVARRPDIPSWLTDGATYGYNPSIQTSAGFQPAQTGVNFGAQLQTLPAALTTVAAQMGARRTLAVPFGWEHDGQWAGIDYLPPVPSAAAWANATAVMASASVVGATVAAAGGHAIGWLVSGYWWVVRRQQTGDGPAFDHSAQAALPNMSAMLVKTRNGSIWAVDAYNAPTGPSAWQGFSVKMCHGHAGSNATLFAAMAGAVDLGVQLLSFDQEIGGGMNSGCYDPSHNHTPGYGPWMFAGIRDTAAAVSRYAAAAGRPLALSTEQTGELLIPTVATFWSRQFAPMNWPWDTTSGGAAPGLFSFIYHEFLPVLAAEFVQGLDGPFSQYFLARYAFAAALTRGLMPTYDTVLVPGIANLTAAAAAYAPVYARWSRLLLQSSRALVAPALTCPQVTSAEGVIPVSVPLVLAGAFLDDTSGAALVVVAQAGDTPAAYALNLTTWAAPPLPVACTGNATLFNGTAVLQFWPSAAAASLSVVSSVLRPYDVHALALYGCASAYALGPTPSASAAVSSSPLVASSTASQSVPGVSSSASTPSIARSVSGTPTASGSSPSAKGTVPLPPSSTAAAASSSSDAASSTLSASAGAPSAAASATSAAAAAATASAMAGTSGAPAPSPARCPPVLVTFATDITGLTAALALDGGAFVAVLRNSLSGVRDAYATALLVNASGGGGGAYIRRIVDIGTGMAYVISPLDAANGGGYYGNYSAGSVPAALSARLLIQQAGAGTGGGGLSLGFELDVPAANVSSDSGSGAATQAAQIAVANGVAAGLVGIASGSGSSYAAFFSAANASLSAIAAVVGAQISIAVDPASINVTVPPLPLSLAAASAVAATPAGGGGAALSGGAAAGVAVGTLLAVAAAAAYALQAHGKRRRARLLTTSPAVSVLAAKPPGNIELASRRERKGVASFNPVAIVSGSRV